MATRAKSEINLMKTLGGFALYLREVHGLYMYTFTDFFRQTGIIPYNNTLPRILHIRRRICCVRYSITEAPNDCVAMRFEII